MNFISAKLRRISLLDVIHLLYLLLSISLLFASFLSIQHIHKIWLLLAGLPLIALEGGFTILQRLLQVIIFTVFYVVIVFLSVLLSDSLLFLAIYLVILVMLTTQFAYNYPQYKYQFVCGVLLAAFALSSPSNVALPFYRCLYIVMAGGIIALCQLIFSFRFHRNQLCYALKLIFTSMQGLSGAIFACFLKPDYPKNFYLYEHRLHNEKNRVMQSLINFKTFIDTREDRLSIEEKNHLDSLLSDSEQLFNMLIDCAQLRTRVKDHTLFLLCSNEMSALAKELQNIFISFLDRKHHLLQKVQNQLGVQIIRFEEVFHHAIQVTAQEPSVFIYFISTLKRLSRRLVDLQQSLVSLNLVPKENTQVKD